MIVDHKPKTKLPNVKPDDGLPRAERRRRERAAFKARQRQIANPSTQRGYDIQRAAMRGGR